MLLLDDDDWWGDAKCRGTDTRLFVLGPGGRPKEAQAVCYGSDDGHECPVRENCLEFAQKHGMVGVWGGELFQYGKVRYVSPWDEVDDFRPRPT